MSVFEEKKDVSNESENKTVTLNYDTWGSFGQHELNIGILKNLKVLNPMELHFPYKGEQKEMEIDGIKVKLINSDSNKNAHREVIVPEKDLLLTINEKKTSGNMYRSIKIYDNNVEDAKIYSKDVKELAKELDNKKVYYNYLVRYVSIHFKDGRVEEVPFEKEYINAETELTGKPKIKLTKSNDNNLYISGDTYHIKDTIKKLGGKWSSFDKAWIIKINNEGDVDKIVQALKDYAEIFT